MSATAFLIVDAQNDFTEGGSLGVAGATAAYEHMRAHLAAHAADYAVLVTTQDWHIDPGAHWSTTPDYVDSWPVHCRADSRGAELAPLVESMLAEHPDLPRLQVRKGQHRAAYSGFEGTVPGTDRPLAAALREHGITDLTVVGVATDHCVRATVLDALTEGFDVTVLTDQIAAVDPTRGSSALSEMARAGAVLR
ncbi:isochorismatase family protein [Raineyella sp.]|nr:isochorismatase family protein [Raineyella sp.]MEA5154347.1 isochorismatase family protein [Raineyella sp.]